MLSGIILQVILELVLLLSPLKSSNIGHPQYLCLDIPQSFNLKFVCFFPIFFFSNILIVSNIDSSGADKSFKNSEFMIIPGPEYASLVTLKSLLLSIGFTTVLISSLYFFAKSKSL